MISLTATLTGNARSIANLIRDNLPDYLESSVGSDASFRMDCVVQAPAGNAGDINIGDANSQDGFIIAGGSAGFNRLGLNTTYINGTAGDTVVILLVD